jgi:hypothetical protein
MLSKAIEVNEPAVFSLIVQVWLIRKGFEPPKGVFIPDLHHGRPGRKRKADEQFRVWSSYNTMNNPTFGKVAKKVFPKEFSQDQKRAADRTRQLYRSYEKHSDAALREAIRKFVSSKGTPGEENSK